MEKRKDKSIQHEELATCLTFDAQDSVLKAANDLNEKMLTRIANIDFVAKGVKYHNLCRSAYFMSAKRSNERKNE